MTYLINTTITVCWVIEPTNNPLPEADYDVYVIKPDKTASYTNDGLTSYTAPTATVQGQATYDVVADQIGLWQVRLNIGTELKYVHHSEIQLYIVDTPNSYSEIITNIPFDHKMNIRVVEPLPISLSTVSNIRGIGVLSVSSAIVFTPDSLLIDAP